MADMQQVKIIPPADSGVKYFCKLVKSNLLTNHLKSKHRGVQKIAISLNYDSVWPRPKQGIPSAWIFGNFVSVQNRRS